MKKTYTITLEDDGERLHMHRICDGFTPIELLGILECTQIEIMEQMSGKIKPDIIKREVIIDEE